MDEARYSSLFRFARQQKQSTAFFLDRDGSKEILENGNDLQIIGSFPSSIGNFPAYSTQIFYESSPGESVGDLFDRDIARDSIKSGPEPLAHVIY